MTLKCVVFDVDDTLYLERAYVESGFRYVARLVAEHWGAEGFFERAWGEFLSGRRGNTFDVVAEEMGLPREVVPELVRAYREHPPEISLDEDVERILGELSARFDLAAVTDGPLQSQRAKVNALRLERFCSPIVLTAEYGPGFGKPHPRAFEEVERARGVRGHECVYVADNPHKDFGAPRDLGWHRIRLRLPGALHEESEGGDDVPLELRAFGELVPVLLGMA